MSHLSFSSKRKGLADKDKTKKVRHNYCRDARKCSISNSAAAGQKKVRNTSLSELHLLNWGRTLLGLPSIIILISKFSPCVSLVSDLKGYFYGMKNLILIIYLLNEDDSKHFIICSKYER